MIKEVLVAIGLMGTTACSDICANTEVERIEAPDGLHSAVLFQRDCGATTGFSTQVSVLAEGEDLSGTGNAFIADDDHGVASAGQWGGPWAAIKWIDSDSLSIRYADGSRIFSQRQKASGIAVLYEAVER